MRAITIITVLLWLSTGLADVYKWVDENGVVQYSDRPLEEDAQAVELPPASLYEAPQYKLPPKTEEPDAVDRSYTQAIITQPQADETVRDNNGEVAVTVNLQPPLRAGHSMSVLVDGRTVFEQVLTSHLILGNVDRGTHQLKVKVMDAKGNEVVTTPVVTFHLHRAIAPKPKLQPR